MALEPLILCDFGQVAERLRATVSSSLKWVEMGARGHIRSGLRREKWNLIKSLVPAVCRTKMVLCYLAVSG